MLFAKNSMYSVAEQAVSAIFALFISVLLARHFGPSGIGLYAYATAICGGVNLITNFGIQTLIKRLIAEDPSLLQKLLNSSLSIRLLISLPISILIIQLLSLFLLNYSYEETIFLHLVNLCIFSTGLFSIPLVAFNSLHRTDWFFFLSSGLKFLNLIVILSVIYFSYSFQDYVVGLFGTLILLTFLAYKKAYSLNRFVGKSVLPHKNITLIKASLPFLLTALAEFLILKIDILMIRSFMDETAVGYYFAVTNILIAMTLPALAIYRIVFPNFISIKQKKGLGEAESFFMKFFYGFFCYALLISLILYFASSEIILILYGVNFESSIPILRICSAAIVFMVLNRLTSTILVALHLEKKLLKANLFGIAINIILNVKLIPLYGIQGAAFATVISEAFLLLFGCAVLRKKFKFFAYS